MPKAPATPTDNTTPEGAEDNEGGLDVLADPPAATKTPSPLDMALRGVRPRPAAHTLPGPFDHEAPATLPSQLFDPGNVTSMEDYIDGQEPALTSALNAFTAMHKAVSKVIEARNELRQNDTMTQAQQVLALSDMQDKLNRTATLAVDAANAALTQAIARDEAALNAPVKEHARGPFAMEIRTAVRTMPQEQRMKFVNDAITEGDATVAGAILGAPGVLSGLPNDMVAALSEKFNRVRNPDAVRRLNMLKTAEARLNKAGGHLLTTTEAVLGARSSTVERIRAAKAAAQKVLG